MLPVEDLVRGITAMGFSALTVDRYGFPDNGDTEVRELEALLGPPDHANSHRLLAWDLRPAAASLLRGLSTGARHALVQQMLDAPRIYVDTDADPIRGRDGRHVICRAGTIMLVNPGRDSVPRDLAIKLDPRDSNATNGDVTIAGRRRSIAADDQTHMFRIEVAPGTSTIKVSANTPDLRCASTPLNTLPAVATELLPVTPAG